MGLHAIKQICLHRVHQATCKIADLNYFYLDLNLNKNIRDPRMMGISQVVFAYFPLNT